MFGFNNNLTDYELQNLIEKFSNMNKSASDKLKDIVNTKESKQTTKEMMLYSKITLNLINLREFRKMNNNN